MTIPTAPPRTFLTFHNLLGCMETLQHRYFHRIWQLLFPDIVSFMSAALFAVACAMGRPTIWHQSRHNQRVIHCALKHAHFHVNAEHIWPIMFLPVVPLLPSNLVSVILISGDERSIFAGKNQTPQMAVTNCRWCVCVCVRTLTSSDL